MDKRAKKILFDTYWKDGKWRNEYSISTEDFEYAKSKGLMFDPITITHDNCIEQIEKYASDITPEFISKAFLCSLSKKRLDWRSGISSYYIAKKLKVHKYTPAVSGHSYNNGVITHTSYTCSVCRDTQYGVIGSKDYINKDLNVLNFERIKWGGVRHGNILYTLFDLQQLVASEISSVTDDDVQIFSNILETIATSSPNDYPGTLENRLKEVYKSNKAERMILIEILAAIGILRPLAYNRPGRGKSDWVFAAQWRGEDKYNTKKVNELFGNYDII